jgi:hypothetical protein
MVEYEVYRERITPNKEFRPDSFCAMPSEHGPSSRKFTVKHLGMLAFVLAGIDVKRENDRATFTFLRDRKASYDPDKEAYVQNEELAPEESQAFLETYLSMYNTSYEGKKVSESFQRRSLNSTLGVSE